MKRRIVAILIALMLVFLVACDKGASVDDVDVPMAGSSEAESDDSVPERDSSEPESDDALEDTTSVFEGEVGDSMRTYFFDFTVESVEVVEEYAGYTPTAGTVLLDVVITTKNTCGDDIEMYDADYQLQWDERSNDDTYAYTLDPLDDDAAPLEYTLEDGESMTFHYVFEAPEDVTEFEICYLEEFSDESVGDIFYVAFSI